MNNPWTPNTVMTFGKYQGTQLKDVPLSYILWVGGYKWDCEKNKLWQSVFRGIKKYHENIRTYLEQRKLCVACDGPIVPIGTSRQNGAGHSDWEGRLLHKQCWKRAVHELGTNIFPEYYATKSPNLKNPCFIGNNLYIIKQSA